MFIFVSCNGNSRPLYNCRLFLNFHRLMDKMATERSLIHFARIGAKTYIAQGGGHCMENTNLKDNALYTPHAIPLVDFTSYQGNRDNSCMLI